MKDSQIVPSKGTDLAVRDESDVQDLKRYLLDPEAAPADLTVDDRPPEEIAAEVSREIIAALLAAESDEELERVEAQGWRDLPGVPVELRGFHWRPSAYTEDGGFPVFLVVRGHRLDTGEQVVLTTGSGNVMAQLANMAERGTLRGAIRQLKVADKATARGFKPCWLETPAAIRQERLAAAAADTAGE